jgi:hypothetical protein
VQGGPVGGRRSERQITRKIARSVPRVVRDPLARAYLATRRWTSPVRGAAGSPRPSVPWEPVRLLVGPANQAGQGWEWCRAAERTLPGVAAQAFTVRRNALGYSADYAGTTREYRDPGWQRDQERYVRAQFSHVLLEALRPVLGNRYGLDCRGDVRELTRHGLSTALVAHGSEIRLPSRHAARERWSPFEDDTELVDRLEDQAQRNGAIMRDFAGPLFVSTPDLLVDVPRAQWLPVVVDVARWATSTAVMERPRPRVIHVPSNAWLKGTPIISTVARRLESAGLIDYQELDGVSHDQMPPLLASADIVIDQVIMGLYGVAACEALAAGRVVVGYVGRHVRDLVRNVTGHEVPIVEADPVTLQSVITEIVADRNRAREIAAEGAVFVREVHDGTMSGQVLGGWFRSAPR